MHWQNSVKKFLKQHKSRIFKVSIVGAVFVAIYGIIFQFSTPFQNYLGKSESAFYQSESKPKPDIVRAVVIENKGKKIKVRVLDGQKRGLTTELNYLSSEPKVGDQIIISTDSRGNLSKYMYSYWRIPGLVAILLAFILIVLLVIGRRGVHSLAGLFISVGIIAFGLIPAIVNGANAFWACMILSIIVAHGWRWRSLVSLVSIYAILMIVVLLSMIGGALGNLTGIYDESSALLQISNSVIDLHGVLIGGIVIATLGVLDDIVTAQTAVIDELHKAQPKLSISKLIKHGYSVGSEHVIALVNTLALAYIGASLPIVLSISSNINSYISPLMIFNTEFIAQEIVRTLISSIALVLAVPISTTVAAYLIKNQKTILKKLNFLKIK